MSPSRWWRWLRNTLSTTRKQVPTWYDPAYRLPSTTLEARVGFPLRRADYALWFLADEHVLRETSVFQPTRISWRDLARVHTPEWLEALTSADTLARVFALEAWDVPVDAFLGTLRLACGGTKAAAQAALQRGGPTINLLGGFHHARPERGAGFCAVNDLAVAVAALRAEGWSGKVGVLDLDFHPPDGTAACLPDAWIGSISGVDWGPLPTVDETLLTGRDPRLYLEALDALLTRVPNVDLLFVVAGGDVLSGDPMGDLGLDLSAIRERDRRVARRLAGRAAVWLPGGGYSRQSWQVLAGTWLEIAGITDPIPADFDPLSVHFSRLAKFRPPPDERIDLSDVEASLGLRPQGPTRLLGVYTAEGVEQALEYYGLLDPIRRLGYGPFRVTIDAHDPGEQLRLFGMADGVEHLLVEVILERQILEGRAVLYVHWMALRHPRVQFQRPPLPGQEVPGLGMAREAGEMLAQMAVKLGLHGVALRPAWFHVAYTARGRFRFLDPKVEANFQGIIRDLGHLPLSELTRAIAAGKVHLGAAPFRWEAAPMVWWSDEKLEPISPTEEKFFIL